MKGWIIFGAIILFFLLLSFLKIGIVIGYKKDFCFALKILFFKIKILPSKEKKLNPRDFTKKKVEKMMREEELKKQKNEQKKKEKKEKKAAEKKLKKELEASGKAPPKKKLREKITDTVTLVKVILDIVKLLFSKLFGYIKTDVRSLKLALGANAADKTALMYGATMTGVTALLDFLDDHSDLKIKDESAIAIIPDFPGHGFEADIDITISFRVWQVFGMIFPPIVKAAKYFIPKLLKKDKQDPQKSVTSKENNAPTGENINNNNGGQNNVRQAQ